jgi:hypothetical protein
MKSGVSFLDHFLDDFIMITGAALEADCACNLCVLATTCLGIPKAYKINNSSHFPYDITD